MCSSIGMSLCDPVHVLSRRSPSPAPTSRTAAARRHGAEGDDLRHVVRAVLANDVVDDLLPALVAEVDVEIGHADTLRVEKALEQQVILHGVDAGDADAVGRDAARARAAPRPDRDAVALGVVDEVLARSGSSPHTPSASMTPSSYSRAAPWISCGAVLRRSASQSPRQHLFPEEGLVVPPSGEVELGAGLVTPKLNSSWHTLGDLDRCWQRPAGRPRSSPVHSRMASNIRWRALT